MENGKATTTTTTTTTKTTSTKLGTFCLSPKIRKI